MSARYESRSVTLDAGARRIRASFRLRNTTTGTWPAGEGFAVGYHLFDRDSATLIVDGPRTPLAAAVAPEADAAVELVIQLPEEDGEYRIIVSPMREGVCWYYERDWPFLLVEATVRDGRATLESAVVSTARGLRLRRLWRGLGKALVYPWRTIWTNRSLIRVMVKRDILGRYRGSFGGALWTVINPLLLMLTYFFVFGVVLRSKMSASDPSRTGFALYFLAGMLPWLAFSDAVSRAPSVILEHRNFVKKLVFAVDTLPINLVLAGLVSEAFAVALYLAGLWLARGAVPATALWLPLLVIPQVLFTAGVAWFLAGLGVFFRDLGQIIGYLMTLWFFLTPICYPESSLPAAAVPLLNKNPIFVLVRGYRDIFLEGRAPAPGSLWKLWIVALLCFLCGHAWFYKLRKSFADII